MTPNLAPKLPGDWINLLIRWAEMYENTEILSPIDRATWRIIAETAKVDASSRVIELASGKGAFACYLAKNYGCRIDGFDINPEFVDYSKDRARELGLADRTTFSLADIRQLQSTKAEYDLGVCLGALYIFREAGWKLLTEAVKPQRYLAISDLVCKKVPAPKEISDIFFDEPGGPLTLNDARKWYIERGGNILREIECSEKAWLEYYDLQKDRLAQISRRPNASKELLGEVEEELRQDRLVRQYCKEYMNYTTFIMEKKY